MVKTQFPHLRFSTLKTVITPLAFNAPDGGVLFSVKFCTEIKGWLRYKTAQKYCRKFHPLRVVRTNVTDDRRICDFIVECAWYRVFCALCVYSTFRHHPHPQATLVRTFVSFAASTAELGHGEKLRTHSITQLI